MTPIDWAILITYATSTLGLGWYFGRQQKDTNEYFVGSGKMNPLLIGVSLFATLLSTISYLAIPGEIIGKGPIYLTNYIAYPFVFVVLGFVILPVYMRQRVTSAYQLLEERLGFSVRFAWRRFVSCLAARLDVVVGVPDRQSNCHHDRCR